MKISKIYEKIRVISLYITNLLAKKTAEITYNMEIIYATSTIIMVEKRDESNNKPTGLMDAIWKFINIWTFEQ
jgi:hypothetical protein